MAAKRKITATRVAAGLAAGKSVSRIAREEHMSRGHVSAIANSDACQQIIAELVASQNERVAAIFSKLLDSIEDGLEARDHKFVFTRLKRAGNDATPTGEEIELASPPDHYARLAAVKRYIQLLTAGRPKPAAQNTAG